MTLATQIHSAGYGTFSPDINSVGGLTIVPIPDEGESLQQTVLHTDFTSNTEC